VKKRQARRIVEDNRLVRRDEGNAAMQIFHALEAAQLSTLSTTTARRLK
jgi:hypothetical protein